MIDNPASALGERSGDSPTGYCGILGMPPVDPCGGSLGAERHDRSVCHLYGAGMNAR